MSRARIKKPNTANEEELEEIEELSVDFIHYIQISLRSLWPVSKPLPEAMEAWKPHFCS